MPYVVLPANNALWYIAQICLGSSFVAPSLFVLRGMLATGFFFLMLWSIIELQVSVDSAVFGGVYMIINLIQLGRLFWERRHVAFDPERERVYMHYFGPKQEGRRQWQCSRVTWSKLCEGSRLATLRQGEAIARAGDRCVSLTFLLEGELSFEQASSKAIGGPAAATGPASVPMHVASGLSVVDAVEYIHRSTARGALWGIDAICSSASARVLILTYDQLDRVAKEDFMVEATVNGICGEQLTHMLFSAESVRLHDCMKTSVAVDAMAANSAANSASEPFNFKGTAPLNNGHTAAVRSREETELAPVFHIA